MKRSVRRTAALDNIVFIATPFAVMTRALVYRLKALGKTQLVVKSALLDNLRALVALRIGSTAPDGASGALLFGHAEHGLADEGAAHHRIVGLLDLGHGQRHTHERLDFADADERKKLGLKVGAQD